MIDVFESGDDPENDTGTAVLLKQTDIEWGSNGMGMDFLYNPNGLERDKWTALRYPDEILNPIVRPFAGAVNENFFLMQDNACPILLECARIILVVRLLKKWTCWQVSLTSIQ